ncbi:MAG TPA: histidine kinase [Flavisolibacter sp.]|nr:histidine kinase [Flavisolibacter sp.]
MTARRYTKYIYRLLCLVVAIFPAILQAADITEFGPFKIQRYTEDEGLISSETTDTYKDSHGFLWVATFSGVSRFDGRNFENFGRESGFTESNVDLVGEDAVGQLFVKSVSNIYQYTGSKTRPFVKYPSVNKFIMAACPSAKDNIWVAYDGEKGLYLLSPKGIMQQVTTSSPVYKMVPGSGSEIYVLEFNGRLSVLKNGTLTLVYTIQPRQPYTNEGIKLYKDAKGGIWTYGANHKYLYSHKGVHVVDSIEVPTNTRWWQWYVGGAGNVYSSSDEGSVFQLIGREWKEILTKKEIKGAIYEVRENEAGVLWITTSGGLLHVHRKQYRNTSASAPGYYYTTDAQGRYILRSDSLLYTIPNAVRHFFALQAEVLTNVYVTREKEVWYCTESAVYYLPYRKSLQKLNTTQTYEGSKAVFRFRRVMEDGKGGLWISSYHGMFYKKGNELKYYWDKEGLTEGAIYTFAIDKNGIFYIAGVHVYALVGERFQNISKQLKLPDEISRLSTDLRKNVWICQGTSTIVKLDYNKAKGFYLADSLSLSLNALPFSATSLCFDTNNNAWISDNTALYCYPYTNGQYAATPFFWNESFSGSPLLFADDQANLQVLSHPLAGNYLRTYSSTNLLNAYNRMTPTVVLTGIRLFKQAFDWNQAGFTTNVLGIPQNLILKPNQNFLRFSFAGLATDLTNSIAYRYRLTGYDDKWSPATEIGEAEYTGLPPGNYRFEVQVRSAGGEWSESIGYSFEVEVIWYLRLWAKVLWGLILVSLIAGVVLYRTRSIKRKAQVKQLLVEEQLKALRAQINPHFLQNTFAFLAHELYNSQNIKAVKAIDRLSVYLRNVLRYSDKASITLEEELEFAEEYLQMQQQLLSIPFTYDIQIAEDVDTFDIQVPSMLLQPIIENALKYGLEEGGENHVSIFVFQDTDYVKCVIRDTGASHPKAAAPLPNSGNGKGIALTIDRIKLFYSHKKLQPHISRASNESGGCDVTILIPLV